MPPNIDHYTPFKIKANMYQWPIQPLCLKLSIGMANVKFSDYDTKGIRIEKTSKEISEIGQATL